MKLPILAALILSLGARAALAAEPAKAIEASIETVSGLQKLTATAPGVLESYVAQPIRLKAARGEWECFQVVVTAGLAALENISVADVDIQGTGQEPAAAGSGTPKAETYWENYVLIDKPSGNRRLEKLYWPDALIPAQAPGQAARRTVAAGKSEVVWVAVHIPYNTAPGSYKGTFALNDETGKSVLQTGFSLEVLPIKLPAPTMRANAALYYEVLRDWYTKAGLNFSETDWAAQRKRYYDFLLDYRINAYDLPVPWNSAEADAYLRDSRVLSVRVPPLDSPDFTVALERLKKNKVLNKAYYYWIDEPAPERYPEVRETTRKLHAIDPKLKHLITLFPSTALKDAADIWSPNIGDAFGLGHLDMQRLAAERKNGRETWWYTMVVPRAPYPTWLVDDDASSVRLYGWMMARWKITGFVYSMVHGWGPNPLQNIRSFAGTNGDGTLLYPAETVGSAGPMPSIRLMLLRDAIEDYELLQLLTQKTRDGLTARVAGPTPAQRIDSEDGWRRGLFRNLLFDNLALRTMKMRTVAAPVKAPVVRLLPGTLRPRVLRDTAYAQPFVFRRFGDESVAVSPKVWMVCNDEALALLAQVDRLQAEGSEWFAMEVAPVNARERWRFVVTAKGRGVVEKHSRDGRFTVENMKWGFTLKPIPNSSKADIYMRIPLSLFETSRGFRFNALYRQFDDATATNLLRRAFPDDGDVTRMPVVTFIDEKGKAVPPPKPAAMGERR